MRHAALLLFALPGTALALPVVELTALQANGPPERGCHDTLTVSTERIPPSETPMGPSLSPDLQPLEGRPSDIIRIQKLFQDVETGGHLRISFFGASHTAADFWTGHLRRRLQDRVGDRGHGFVLPRQRGQDINLCTSSGWGLGNSRNQASHDIPTTLSGTSMRSDDPRQFAWVQTTAQNPHGRLASRFEVFLLAHPEGGHALIDVDGGAPQSVSTQAPQPSLLQVRVRVHEGPHRLRVRPQGDGEVVLYGVSVERDVPGVIVDALGVPGSMARSWLERNPVLNQEGLRRLDPDLLVLAYGTNEANDTSYALDTYRQDLDLVLREMRYALPDTPCLLVGPSDRVESSQRPGLAERTQAVAEIQRRIAPVHGCAFWDWQQATGGPGSQAAWRAHEPPLVASDLLHYTPEGYQASADLLLLALDTPIP